MSANQQRKPTISDVARLAKVSTATVSYVLNGKNRVGDATRQRVLAAVRQLGYQPDMAALGLSSRRSRTVGLVLPHSAEYVFSTSFFPELLRGLSRSLSGNGYAMLLATTESGAEMTEVVESMIRGRSVEGLVFVGAKASDQAYLEELSADTPLVVVGGFPASRVINYVDADNVHGATIAVRHLLHRGRRRIGFINGSDNYTAAKDRLTGYRTALEEAGIAFDERLVAISSYTTAGGHQAMLELLNKPNLQLDGVFAAGDVMAVGAYNALLERGIRIGEEVAFIGFGDTPLAAVMQPPMTVVRQPVQMLGEEAIRLLLRIIQGGEPSPQRVILPVELHQRASTIPNTTWRNGL